MASCTDHVLGERSGFGVNALLSPVSWNQMRPVIALTVSANKLCLIG